MRMATDLKDRILAAAELLFSRHGFERTTNRQIAEAVGCTTAALYYYYPEGKRQLLREVARQNAMAIARVIENTRDAASLPELLIQMSQGVTHTLPELARRLQWLQAEFSHLGKRERDHLRQQFITLHSALQQRLARFTPDDDSAYRLAWLVMCAAMGYAFLFDRLEISWDVSFTREHLFQTLTYSSRMTTLNGQTDRVMRATK